jgi:AraC-like DNA-binding protein
MWPKYLESELPKAEKPIADVRFSEPAGTPPGVAVLSLRGLYERARDNRVDPYAPMRPDFHHLITVGSGQLGASVDFTEHRVGPGEWLWTQPHQILQFYPDLSAVSGTVVLFRSAFLDPVSVVAHADRLTDGGVVVCSAAATDAARLLVTTYEQSDELPHDARIDVIRHVLSALVIRIAYTASRERVNATNTTFLRFREAVEHDFAQTHRVEDYARVLGYSTRTLTRACREATGHGAKRVIDERVVLEAKRLLVHTELSGLAIGARIGLPDPSAFTKFFRTRTGETPAAFRTRARGARPPAVASADSGQW